MALIWLMMVTSLVGPVKALEEYLLRKFSHKFLFLSNLLKLCFFPPFTLFLPLVCSVFLVFHVGFRTQVVFALIYTFSKKDFAKRHHLTQQFLDHRNHRALHSESRH